MYTSIRLDALLASNWLQWSQIFCVKISYTCPLITWPLLAFNEEFQLYTFSVLSCLWEALIQCGVYSAEDLKVLVRNYECKMLDPFGRFLPHTRAPLSCRHNVWQVRTSRNCNGPTLTLDTTRGVSDIVSIERNDQQASSWRTCSSFVLWWKLFHQYLNYILLHVCLYNCWHSVTASTLF